MTLRAVSTSAVALLLILSLAGAARAAVTCPDGATLPGIDVSKWQGSIDWDAVAASGVRYAFIRVNHGLEDIDERFDENWAGAKASGVLRGAYQYFLNEEDALTQAQLLLERMGPLGPADLPPVIDVEDSGAATQEELRAKIWVWLDEVEGALGVKPLIYTGQYYWNTRVNSSEFEEAGYPLWFANYNVDCPNLANTFTRWDFWQKSSTGSVPGISGNVDLNEFNGDEAELFTFQVGEPACGDGRCTGDEDEESCDADCDGCRPIPATGRVVDDQDACASFAGPPEAWRWNGDGGHEGAHRWTYAFAGAAPENYGEYALTITAPGSYEVEVYVDGGGATLSQAARYTVRADGALSEVVIDQSDAGGWVSLGEHTFALGGDQSVRLDDDTGEAVGDQRRLVFDAVRLSPISVTLPDAGPPPVDAGDEPPDAGSDEDDAGTSDAGGLSEQDAGPPLDLPPSVGGGCACGASSSSGAALPFAALLLMLGRRRRHRRAGRRDGGP